MPSHQWFGAGKRPVLPLPQLLPLFLVGGLPLSLLPPHPGPQLLPTLAVVGRTAPQGPIRSLHLLLMLKSGSQSQSVVTLIVSYAYAFGALAVISQGHKVCDLVVYHLLTDLVVSSLRSNYPALLFSQHVFFRLLQLATLACIAVFLENRSLSSLSLNLFEPTLILICLLTSLTLPCESLWLTLFIK